MGDLPVTSAQIWRDIAAIRKTWDGRLYSGWLLGLIDSCGSLRLSELYDHFLRKGGNISISPYFEKKNNTRRTPACDFVVK